MDNIAEKISQVVEKIKGDPEIAKKFQDNPADAVRGLTGVDVPEDQLQSVITAVKSKVSVDSVGEALSGLKGLLGKDKE